MIKRAVVAFIGISILLFVWFFLGSLGLVGASSLLSIIGFYEMSAMAEKKSYFRRVALFTSITALFLVETFAGHSQFTIIFFFIVATLFANLRKNMDSTSRLTQISLWMVGGVYCGLLSSITVSGVLEHGGAFFLALTLISFSTDTFAYLVGKSIGSRPLSAQISPNKTIEGSIGGLIAGTLIGSLFLTQLAQDSPLLATAGTSFLASLFSQAGDLFESIIKRHCNVKDSGSLLPGHGGILDRIDGLLFASPILLLWTSFYL